MDPYITCKELIDFLADYVDGKLAGKPLHEFERHLAVCPACVNYIDSYKATRTLCRAALADDAAPPFKIPEELITAILAARKKSAD